ncbi:MAG: efflux RND transporter permease subunit [Flavobacteriales bacterium]|nr:efflux RND transporter permease subunit [Flavobacteriales bacterium]MBK6894234.1 efflux RND transporter permease subunit [Flavobacteriales bacterium]MBK9598524.1 efflux RND transporter permease subunit [Flavobacteriales bacterium]QQS73431.1 MAG: efflux RND transporter permease subunit [Flavobacteriales bacterium]HQV39867.1 efflux RND transporter permease subunit [Flavobacteriales bacterium]
MNISSISINRPVLASVISILIVLFGIVGFSYLGVREFPSVDPPVITVTTNYTGANADIMESQVTEPLEESINGIAGIRSLTSISSDGRSSITVEFELDVDLEAAANDVRDRVSRALKTLPQDVDPPITVKSDADAGSIVSMTIQSDQRSLLELTDIATNQFKERLQTIPGVSTVQIWGEKKYSMKLLLDPLKMAGFGITPLDVNNALARENVELPSGSIEGANTELTIRTLGRLETEDQFNAMIIREDGGNVVRMRDIGKAELLPENEKTLLRGDGGVPMVAVAVTPQPGSNYIAIADAFYKRVAEIKKDMPSDLRYTMALDTTVSIRKAISEVEDTIVIAFLLVVIIIFVFLRDWRTTLIPVIAIPISLIGSFFIMYVAGFSINILTLLAIVLATGIVVDDAIVVLENIYAKIEGGMDPVEAGHRGSKEITFAIISTTVTLAAVFLPVVFLSGLTGRLFREFGVVVAGSVLISAVVSLTLTPMMSARWLKHRDKPSKFYASTERFYERLTDSYSRLLERFVKRVSLTSLFVFMLGIGGLIWYGMKNLPSELAPNEDKSRFMLMSTAPEGTSFDKMDDYLSNIIGLVDTMKETQSTLSVTAPGFGSTASTNTGFVRVSLVPPEDRTMTQDQLAKRTMGLAQQYNFARSFAVQEATIGGGRFAGLPVQYVIQAPDFKQLREVIPKFMEAAQADSTFSVVDLNLKFNKPELNVEIDRDRAKALGVSVRDIAQTLQLYFSGQRFGYFIFKGKQYQVIGQAARNNRDKPLDLTSAYVRNDKGQLVQMDNLVTLTMRSNPPQLYRYNRYVSATVSANTEEGKTLGDGIAAMDRIAKETLPSNFSTSLSGVSKEFAESSSSLLFAFLLALALIFLILAAQFESWVDPLIVMFTVPLAIAGALLSLWLGGHTLNIFSEIGIIVLIGLVTKNGILIVEFANQRQEHGLLRTAAVLDSARQRFRPILMTTFAMALGSLPIALGLGAASKSRVPMGVAIVGGLLFALVLTLFVVPALYSKLASGTDIPDDSATDNDIESPTPLLDA